MSREIGIAIGSFPGFKFSPTEEELILYYLQRKIQGFQKCVEAIAEIDITCYEPWDLPEKSVVRSNDEWFFFSNRGRKYPRGLQSKRATQFGYWKATGKERNVKSGNRVIGTKRTLVFHKGRAPKGKRTEWIMHEYCLSGTPQESYVVCRLRKVGGLDCNDIPPRESNQATGESSTSTLLDDQQQKYIADGNVNIVENEEINQWLTPPDLYNNPHSVDCDESESQYNKKPQNLNFQGECCSSAKDYEGEEDDCFADIVNDDIIELDGSSLSSSTDIIIRNDILNDDFIDFKFEQPTDISPPVALPFQGTANRRIRLKMQRNNKTKTAVPKKSSCIEDEMYCIVAESAHWPHCLITTMFDVAANHRHILVFVVLLLCLWLLIRHNFHNDNFNGLEDLGYGSM